MKDLHLKCNSWLFQIVLHVGATQNLEEGRQSLEELWATRKLKLDLCLQLRMFEREALEVITMFSYQIV